MIFLVYFRFPSSVCYCIIKSLPSLTNIRFFLLCSSISLENNFTVLPSTGSTGNPEIKMLEMYMFVVSNPISSLHYHTDHSLACPHPMFVFRPFSYLYCNHYRGSDITDRYWRPKVAANSLRFTYTPSSDDLCTAFAVIQRLSQARKSSQAARVVSLSWITP